MSALDVQCFRLWLQAMHEVYMKIAIVGSGALGLYYGALLQLGGQDVHFLLRRDYDAVLNRGLKVFSINGDFVLPKVKGYCRSADIGAVDLVLIGLKTFANDMLAELIKPLIKEGTRILTLQNGLGNEQALADLFGSERVIGGVAFLCSNRGEPGVVHHLGAGRIIIGQYIRESQNSLDELVTIFNICGIDCRVTDDLLKTRWEKLVWNIPFNGICALLLQTVDRLLASGSTRTLIREIMIEVIQAANTQNLSANIPQEYADNMLAFTDKMGVYKPSMQIDREEGRQMEIPAIFRIPLELGQKQGIAMPRTEMLATLLEQEESVPINGRF
jgi:2-dehydropantoate 2-reductase